jgi:tetratricopeptide (TPR) repeat protein
MWRWLKRSSRNASDNARSCFQNGINNFKQGHFDKTISDFSKAVELNPYYDLAYANRGSCYGMKGLNTKAIDDLTKAIALNPIPIHFLNRGITYNILDRYEEAVNDLTKVISLNPNDSLAYTHRGRALIEKGSYELAIADLTKALELDPSDEVARANRELAVPPALVSLPPRTWSSSIGW